MQKRIMAFMEQYGMLERGDKVVLGVSGGADSVALFRVFDALRAELELTLIVVHINHGIRQEAREDAAFVEALCREANVPFRLFEADIRSMALRQKCSEEEMGRNYRYRCFFQVMKETGARKLALAHHMGDQAETVLFHLIRGTDLAGMSGMRPVSMRMLEDGDELECQSQDSGSQQFVEKSRNNRETDTMIQILRPLLCAAKKEIVAWLTSEGICWREDRTNRENLYARNRLRNQVMPMLQDIHNGAARHIVDFSKCASEYERFFKKSVEEYMDRQVIFSAEGCETDRILLREQDPLLVRGILYEMLSRLGGRRDLAQVHVELVASFLWNLSGRKLSLPGGLEALLSYDLLRIEKCRKADDVRLQAQKEGAVIDLSSGRQEGSIDLPGGGRLCWSLLDVKKMSPDEKNEVLFHAGNAKNIYTKYFDCDTIKGMLYVRTPESGDYFLLREDGGHKKLSRFFIDCRIPAERRSQIPVAAVEHEVLWVIGMRRCGNYRITEDTRQILKLTCEGI